jgi:hypothetical protein
MAVPTRAVCRCAARKALCSARAHERLGKLQCSFPKDYEPGKGYLDDRIDPEVPRGKRLHFTDCMNNGGQGTLARISDGNFRH